MPLDQGRIIWIGSALLCVAWWLLSATADLAPIEALIAVAAERSAPYHEFSGPLPVALSKFGILFFGKTEFGVRFLAPLVGLATLFGTYRLARALTSESAAAWAVAALAVTPLFFLGSAMLTPALCLAAAWIWSLTLLWLALKSPQLSDPKWAGAGLCAGLAFLSHPAGFLLPVALLCWLGMRAKGRRRLFSLGPYLFLGGFFVLSAWPLVWLFWGGGQSVGEAWLNLPEPRTGKAGMALQVALFFLAISPLLLVGIVWAWWEQWKNPESAGRDPALFCVMTTAIPLIAAFYSALKGHPSIILIAMALPPGMILLSSAWELRATPGTRYRVVFRTGALFIAALCSFGIARTDLVRYLGISLPYHEVTKFGLDPSGRVRGWTELGEFLGAVASEASGATKEGQSGKPVFLITDEPGLAALMDFYVPEYSPLVQPSLDHPRVFLPPSTVAGTCYARWMRYDALVSDPDAAQSAFLGAHGIFFSRTPISDEGSDPLTRSLSGRFKRIEPAALARFMRGGDLLREIRVTACYRYEGQTL